MTCAESRRAPGEVECAPERQRGVVTGRTGWIIGSRSTRVLAALWLVLGPAAAAAQTQRFDCAPCRIVRTEIAALDAAAQPDLEPKQWASIVRLRDGRFLAAPVAAEGTIAEFSREGRIVRGIGRLGMGPQEFMPIASIVADGDEGVAVFERGSRRLTMLAGNGSIRSRVAIPFSPAATDVIKTGGRWLIAATSRLPQYAGAYFHITDASGAVTRSFGWGGPMEVTRFNGSVPIRRAVAPRSDGGHWCVLITYGQADVLEEWDASGSLVRRVDLARDWPPSKARTTTPAFDRRAATIAVHEQSDGSLWVTTHVLKDRQPAGAASNEHGLPADLDEAYRTTVRAFDPRAGRLLASIELDGHVMTGAVGSMWWETRERPSGEPVGSVAICV